MNGTWLYQVVLLFTKGKAKLDTRNNGGLTPLHAACLKSHFKTVQLLVEKGKLFTFITDFSLRLEIILTILTVWTFSKLGSCNFLSYSLARLAKMGITILCPTNLYLL